MNSSLLTRARRAVTRFARPAIGGALLAGLLLFGLMVISDPDDFAPPDEWSAHSGALTGRQPAVEQPASPTATAPPPAAEVVAASPAPVPPPVPAATTPTPPRPPCQALFDAPDTLLTDLAATGTRAWQTEHRGAVLHHTRGRFARGQAAQAFGSLADTAASCGEFTAVLGGDRPATVRLTPVASHRAEAYMATVTVTDDDPTSGGWLVIHRSGSVVSVLHRVGPQRYEFEGPAGLHRATAELLPTLSDLRDELAGLLPDPPVVSRRAG